MVEELAVIKMLFSTLKVYEDYKDKVPDIYKADFLFHIADICMRFGNLKEGWKLLFKAVYQDRYILKDKRKVLSILKRGFRLDRLLKI